MHLAWALVLIFFYEVGAAIVLPTPSELPLVSYQWVPLWLVFLFAVAGKFVGSYVIFFLGDRMKDTERFQRMADRFPWIRAVLRWSERFVRRYGVLAVFVLLSIPGFPDTVSLYLFAFVGRRPVLYATASALGTAVRMGLVLAGLIGIRHVTGTS